MRWASWVSSISAKTAPSSARSGTSASSRGRIMRDPFLGARASRCIRANVRPVLNGGSRYTQRILPANRDRELRERGEVVAVHEEVLGLARASSWPLDADSGASLVRPADPRLGDLAVVALAADARHHAREAPLEAVHEHVLLRQVDRLREVRQQLAFLGLADLLAAADEERDRFARDLVRVAERAVGGERLEEELRVRR